MNKERRTNFRIPLNLPVRYDGMSGAQEARVEDISLGGCFVSARGQVNEGDAITVEIQFPSGEWMTLRGRVTVCHPGIGFGLEFSSLTAADEARLAELLTNQL
jgi:hypothetical protein